MSTVKITLKVNADLGNLSEKESAILSGIGNLALLASGNLPICGCGCNDPEPGKPEEAPESKPEPKPGRPAKPTKKVEKAPEPAPVPAPAPAPSDEPAVPSKGIMITLEDLRELMREKLKDGRDVIKAKLNELGVAKVTALDPKYYDEFYNFLNTL